MDKISMVLAYTSAARSLAQACEDEPDRSQGLDEALAAYLDAEKQLLEYEEPRESDVC